MSLQYERNKELLLKKMGAAKPTTNAVHTHPELNGHENGNIAPIDEDFQEILEKRQIEMKLWHGSKETGLETRMKAFLEKRDKSE